jgi:hypothetical protein
VPIRGLESQMAARLEETRGRAAETKREARPDDPKPGPGEGEKTEGA